MLLFYLLVDLEFVIEIKNRSFVSNPVNTRRKFLFDCSATAMAAMVVPGGVLAGAVRPAANPPPLENISQATFSGQLNTPFEIHTEAAGVIRVVLDEVRSKACQPPKPGRRPPQDAGHEKFSLVFSGSRAELLEQNTYTFKHPVLGTFDLFIVPILTRHPRKIDYETVFNRPPRGGGSAPAPIQFTVRASNPNPSNLSKG